MFKGNNSARSCVCDNLGSERDAMRRRMDEASNVSRNSALTTCWPLMKETLTISERTPRSTSESGISLHQTAGPVASKSGAG